MKNLDLEALVGLQGIFSQMVQEYTSFWNPQKTYFYHYVPRDPLRMLQHSEMCLPCSNVNLILVQNLPDGIYDQTLWLGQSLRQTYLSEEAI